MNKLYFSLIKKSSIFMLLLLASIGIINAQDTPCTATVVPITGATCTPLQGSSSSATPSTLIPSPTCGNYQGGETWYQVTLPSNGLHVVIDITGNGSFSPEVAVYSGDACGNLSLEDCNSSGASNTSIRIEDGDVFENSGKTYWVSVWDAGNDSNDTYEICTYAEEAPIVGSVSACGDNYLGGDRCADAILLSAEELDNYCGSTAGYDGYPSTTNLPGNCGVLENNTWLAFIPSSSDVSLEFTSANCISQGTGSIVGIQVRILATDDCASFTAVSGNCIAQTSEGMVSWTGTGLTVGQIYYISIDGTSGAHCDYSISVVEGVSSINITASDDEICAGESVNLNASAVGAGPFTYSWTPTAGLDNPTIANPVATPTSTTEYTVTVSDASGSTVTKSITIEVLPASPTGVTIAGTTEICENASNISYEAISTGATTYNWTVTGTGTTINGASNQAIVNVDFGADGGQLCVDVSNECTAGTPIRKCIDITTSPAISFTVDNPPVECWPTTINLSGLPLNISGASGGIPSFHYTESAAIDGWPIINPPIVDTTGTYWIRLQTSDNCYDVQPVFVDIQHVDVSVGNSPTVCEPTELDLNAQVTVYENGWGPAASETYYTDSLEAANGVNPLSSSVVDEGGTYWLRYETTYGCFDIEPIEANIISRPDLEVLQHPFICSGESVDLQSVVYTDHNDAEIVSTSFFMNEQFAAANLLPMSNTVVSSAGNYYMRAVTPNGCFRVVEITVSETTRPDGEMLGSGTVCPGGEAALRFELDGVAPFDVTYSNGTTDSTLIDIPNGHVHYITTDMATTYTLVSFTDATGCDGDITGNPVEIAMHERPTATISGSSLTCGTATADVTFNFTGNGPFDVVYTDGTDNFTLNNLNNGHVASIDASASNVYTLVSVTDNNGCEGTLSGLVTITNYPQLVTTDINAVCSAVDNGYTVTFDIEGGDPDTYSVSGDGTLTGNTFVSDVIPSGVAYNFTVTSPGSGCDDIVVNGVKNCACVTSSGTMDVSSLIDLCIGETVDVGSLHQGDEILASGELLGFVIHDNAGAALGNIIDLNTTGTFGHLPTMTPGVTYYVSAIAGAASSISIIDLVSNCTSVSFGTPIRFNDKPEVSISGDAEICRGDTTSLVLDFTKGTPPFDIVYSDGLANYTLDDVVDGEIIRVSPLINTSYSIISVVDNTGASCTGIPSGVAEITVKESPQAQHLEFVCNDNNDEYQVIFHLVGGDPSTYAVQGNGTYDPATNTFTSNFIESGEPYSFYAVDGNGCEPTEITGTHVCDCITQTVIMTRELIEVCDNSPAVASFTGSPTMDGDDAMAFVLHSSSGNQLGEVLLTSITPSFDYDEVLEYGEVYYISAVVGNDDGTGIPILENGSDPCLSVATPGQPVIFHQTPHLDLLGDTTICAGTSQTLTFNFNGEGPYNVSYTDGSNLIELDGVPNGYTVEVSPTEATTYSLVSLVSGGPSGCQGNVFDGQNTVTVDVIERPTATNISTTCNEAGTRYVISFEIVGGDPSNYVVGGSPGTLTGNVFTSDNLLSGLPYYFEITDGTICDPVILTDVIRCNCTPDILPEIRLAKNITCHGDTDGQLSVVPQNGIAPYTYEWDNGQEGNLVTDLATGWHKVTMTDGNGCLSQDSFFLGEPTPITAEYLVTDVTCTGEKDGKVEFLNLYGGGGDYEFHFEEAISNIGYEFFGMSAGEYVAVITDKNNCVVRDTVVVEEPDSISIDLGENQTIYFGDSIELYAQFNQAVSNFYWLASTGVEVPDSNDYIEYVKPLETTVFRVHAVNEFGCTGTGEVKIYVDRTIPVYVPNAFSPNKDGINDKLRVYLGQGVVKVVSFEVYSRWGGQMYVEKDIDPVRENWGWDGRYQSEFAPNGVYIYNTVVQLENGKIQVISGDVALIR